MNKPKYELVAAVHQWAMDKLSAGENVQGLLVSNHPSGMKMAKYDLPTTEEVIAACEKELAGDLSDATEYAFLYNAFLKLGEELTPVLVFRMEGRGDQMAAQFTQRYEVKKALFSNKLKFKALEDFQAMKAGPCWLK